MSLPGEEDWLLRPVIRRILEYTDLIDGSVDLADVALLNDALTVYDENRRMAEEAVRR